MKNLISIFALFVSLTAVAQESVSRGSLKKIDKSVESKTREGLRFGLLKALLETKINLDSAISGKSKIDENVLGLTVGYKKLPIGEMGYVNDLTYLFDAAKPENGLLRAAGNFAYAPDDTLHLRGGLNLTKAVGENSSDLSPRLGLQAAVGIQFSPTVAFELGYSSMKQGLSYKGFNGDAEYYGLEFGVAGTF